MDVMVRTAKFLKNEAAVKEIAAAATDYAITKGILMRTNSSPNFPEHAPFTLFPSPVSKKLFDQAYAVQQDFNLLLHKISHDFEFMRSALSSVMETDEFTRRLFDIYEIVHKEKPTKTELSIIRSDYMFQQTKENTQSLKQIEVNMIASSFGGIGSDKMAAVHKFSLRHAGLKEFADTLPQNNARTDITQGIFDAWKHYGKRESAILFIVLQKELNIFDQRTAEFGMYDIDPDIKILRHTLTDVEKHGRLDANGNLFIRDQEIAIVYYRRGYGPEHYPTPKEWDARLMLDRSNAINCPSAGHQLVGTKKMQQILAQPHVLEKFIEEPAAKRIKNTFVGFDGLEMGAGGDAAIEKALQNPECYVLKPQLEGGGNNFYNDGLVKKLNEVRHDNRRFNYILMEKVRPMPITNVLLRAGTGCNQYKPVTAVSELGIFGIVLANGEHIMQNIAAGHLLRTKPSHFCDGGVANGVAVLDSPIFV